MNPPKVSILIPVYNGETFLAECFDSILAQDFGDFEVLVSDDGSKDGSADLIQTYARRDARIRYWRNPHNLGIGGNFNACLQAARGEFVKYLLQDDKFVNASALRRLVAKIESDASLSLVASATHLIDAQSALLGVRGAFAPDAVLDGRTVIARCLINDSNFIGEPSLVLFRKSQAARGFDASFKQLLDLEMWFHLLEQGRFGYLAEPLCAFRQHPAQQTAANIRSGVAAKEHLLLAQQYVDRPWLRKLVPPELIFQEAYNFRKGRRPNGGPLLALIAKNHPLYSRQYAIYWLKYKVSRPFHNLSRSLDKRGWGTGRQKPKSC